MTTATVAGERLELDVAQVHQAVSGLEPEPLSVHYVVIEGRRYPPKQVLAAVSGLDRADFTTHQARSILRRLGFGVHRVSDAVVAAPPHDSGGPHGGREAAALAPYASRWVAQQGQEVIFDADSPDAVLRWLRRHGKTARVWRIPASPRDMGSTLSTP